jgi:hypothetical protein
MEPPINPFTPPPPPHAVIEKRPRLPPDETSPFPSASPSSKSFGESHMLSDWKRVNVMSNEGIEEFRLRGGEQKWKAKTANVVANGKKILLALDKCVKDLCVSKRRFDMSIFSKIRKK